MSGGEIGDFGARILGNGLTQFRFWAPDAKAVTVRIAGGETAPMQRDEHGVFTARLQAPAGTRYRYGTSPEIAVPDPASRAQAGDVHDDSLVVDREFAWVQNNWRGRPWAETVVYELHAGAYGGFAGVAAQLPRLAALGVTAIELMPIADFPGQRNWGYDGVLPYAPDRAYGSPEDLKTLIDKAHGLGLQMFLDVVYNHFGPDGNYLNAYAKSFFRADIHTPWGNAIDFRRPQVQRFFIENALYWLHDYRFDGLRFDAVHAIQDRDFLHQLAAEIRANAPAGRHIHLILENEENDPTLIDGGIGQKFDAQWTDDWHHCAHVLLTGESEGYYGDFPNPAALLARCLAEGFAYQGEPSAHAEGAARGAPSGHLPPSAFVICLQNHDQIGNRALGERLTTLARPAALRAAVALLLLTPQIPMIYMGEEWGCKKPFLFFTDHHDELGRLVTAGRRKEFAHFAAFTNAETREKIPDPNAQATFAASMLVPPVNPSKEEQGWTELYTQLLSIRRKRIMPRLNACTALGALALSDKSVRAAWRMNDGATLTIASNLGATPVGCAAGGGRMLFGEGGFANAALNGFTTCAWLDDHV